MYSSPNGIGVGTAPIALKVSMHAGVGSTRSFVPFSPGSAVTGCFVNTQRPPKCEPQVSTEQPARFCSSAFRLVPTGPSSAFATCA